jgi:hypothetical protein
MIYFKSWLESSDSFPRYLYHVTPSCDEVLKTGFKTSSQLPPGSTVMGGSHQNSVSFTYDLKWASYYKEALEEVRDMLNDSDYMYSDKMWDRLLKKFPLSSNGRYLIDLTKNMIYPKKDEHEKMQLFFHMLPQIFDGHFPLIFGSGLKRRLSGNPNICILKVDTSGLSLDLGESNPKEKEIRVKNPELISLDRIDVVS